MNLIIDIGNTQVKAAVFKQDALLKLVVFDKKRILSEVKKILKNFSISSAILSSVAIISQKKLEKLQSFVPIIFISATTKVPFINNYETPKTLGIDRIGLASAAVKLFPQKNVLVIDAGTCITYDFITKKSEYLGGAIAPGIKMRYTSLHTFTANLPDLPLNSPKNFIGKTTTECINSGVVNGVFNEIEGVIHQYKEEFKDLTVVLTGGDTNFLAKQLKSSIFAHRNFLLYGLNEILTLNKK